MSPEPRPPEVFRKSLGDLRHRKTGRIGGDNSPWLANGLNLLKQGPFDVEILDYSFNDPIDISESF